MNNNGSYSCECEEGYEGDGYECFNICEKFLGGCGENARCRKEEETEKFDCLCDDGFIGDGKLCQDVNECMDNTTCSISQNCQNDVGGYKCFCKDGFRTVLWIFSYAVSGRKSIFSL